MSEEFSEGLIFKLALLQFEKAVLRSSGEKKNQQTPKPLHFA